MKRIIKLLKRKKKNIKLLYFHHITSPYNEHELSMRYKFANALFYQIDGNKTTSNNLIIPIPEDEKRIKLTVYGLLRKSSYTISITPNEVLFTKINTSVKPGFVSKFTTKCINDIKVIEHQALYLTP